MMFIEIRCKRYVYFTQWRRRRHCRIGDRVVAQHDVVEMERRETGEGSEQPHEKPHADTVTVIKHAVDGRRPRFEAEAANTVAHGGIALNERAERLE